MKSVSLVKAPIRDKEFILKHIKIKSGRYFLLRNFFGYFFLFASCSMILAVFIFTDLELQKKLTSLLFIITGIMGLFFLKDARKDFKNKLAALVGGDPIEAQVIRRSKHGIIFESRPLDMLTLKFVDKNGIKRHCNVKARNKFIQNYNEGDSLLGFYNTETNSTYFPGPFGYAVKLI